jgi:hypothetical protein
VANSTQELKDVIFANVSGGITGTELGADGNVPVFFLFSQINLSHNS